ncbi:transposase [Streptomyces sp. NBC_01275]|uniref:enoyl-CoA hydratase/isomerase family protein n=1 Tax=Streptomyces sp. NBC_01275 TaxID=2903807 RepID=UPI00225535BA|nr:transposase [Streptomyces sp. NBC_01275]MCX4759501.1 transposase [Streptomyces sp. NBC_01275]
MRAVSASDALGESRPASSDPGISGGGVEWLAALVGRSRSLEIVLGADDFDADIAERYGWINRAVPGSELDAFVDAFVDAFAERVSRFEKRVLETGRPIVEVAKDLGINETTLASWVSRARRAGDRADR